MIMLMCCQISNAVVAVFICRCRLLVVVFFLFKLTWFLPLAQRQHQTKCIKNRLGLKEPLLVLHFVMMYHQDCILHFSIRWSAFQVIPIFSLFSLNNIFFFVFAASHSTTNINRIKRRKNSASRSCYHCGIVANKSTKHFWIKRELCVFSGTTTNYGLDALTLAWSKRNSTRVKIWQINQHHQNIKYTFAAARLKFDQFL